MNVDVDVDGIRAVCLRKYLAIRINIELILNSVNHVCLKKFRSIQEQKLHTFPEDIADTLYLWL